MLGKYKIELFSIVFSFANGCLNVVLNCTLLMTGRERIMRSCFDPFLSKEKI